MDRILSQDVDFSRLLDYERTIKTPLKYSVRCTVDLLYETIDRLMGKYRREPEASFLRKKKDSVKGWAITAYGWGIEHYIKEENWIHEHKCTECYPYYYIMTLIRELSGLDQSLAKKFLDELDSCRIKMLLQENVHNEKIYLERQRARLSRGRWDPDDGDDEDEFVTSLGILGSDDLLRYGPG